MSRQHVMICKSAGIGLFFFLGLKQAEAQSAPSVAPIPTAPSAAAPPAFGSTVPVAAVPPPVAPVATVPVAHVGGQTTSGAREVTPDWVLKRLLANNLTLEVASLNSKQASEATHLQDGRFPYNFQADAGYTRARSPSLGANGVVTSERSSLVIGSQISKTYSSGTTATLRAEGERFDSTRPSTGQGTLSSGLGYQAAVRATVSQPLLSGYGATVNEAGLRAAQINEVRLQRSYERQTSELIRDALSAYWELWYAGRSIEIQDSALKLALSQQRDAEARVQRGALSPADALKFRTQVATLNEALLSAQATERVQALELGRLLGTIDEAYDWRASVTEPEEHSFLARKDLVDSLQTNSPAVADLKEALRLAEEQRRTAGDEYRSRLDLLGWVESAGMAAGGHVVPAAKQIGRLGAVSVYGGVTYQTTLDSQRLSSAKAQAEYEVRIAQSNLKLAVQALQSQSSQLLVKAEQARVSVVAATQTLEVTNLQAQNERQRFALGAATPLDVQVAEEALRQAQLRVVRARVDRVKSWLSLAHASGELLRRHPVTASGSR